MGGDGGVLAAFVEEIAAAHLFAVLPAVRFCRVCSSNVVSSTALSRSMSIPYLMLGNEGGMVVAIVAAH